MNKVAECTDVVEVSVRKHNAANLVLVCFKPGNIWRNVVDTWVICPWEQESHVDDDDVVFVFDRHHVFADTHFTESTDRDNP